MKQIDKFKKAARELETDNDPAAFDRRMKRLKLKSSSPPKAKKAAKRKASQ